MHASVIGAASSAIMLLALGALPCASAAPVALRNADENPVARRLAGRWVFDQEINQRRRAQLPRFDTIEFISDPEVAQRIPARYDDTLSQHAAYMSGTMRLHEAEGSGDWHEFPFILIEREGCPHVVFFLPRDGDPMGNPESFYVMLAGGHDPSGDLLFLGGDHAREATVAFVRAPEAGGER